LFGSVVGESEVTNVVPLRSQAPQSIQPQQLLYSRKQAAKLLGGKSIDFIKLLERRGLIKHIKFAEGGYVSGPRSHDDELLSEAQRIAGTRTKRATVDYALRELVRRRARQRITELRGTVEWEGDLDESRRGRLG
jgi:hypothetical protein